MSAPGSLDPAGRSRRVPPLVARPHLRERAAFSGRATPGTDAHARQRNAARDSAAPGCPDRILRSAVRGGRRERAARYYRHSALARAHALQGHHDRRNQERRRRARALPAHGRSSRHTRTRPHVRRLRDRPSPRRPDRRTGRQRPRLRRGQRVRPFSHPARAPRDSTPPPPTGPPSTSWSCPRIGPNCGSRSRPTAC